MIAVNGVYDNGTLNLDIPAPVSKANVIVIFPDNEKANKTRAVSTGNNASSNIDFTKYMGHGKKMFASTAEINRYVEDSRHDRL